MGPHGGLLVRPALNGPLQKAALGFVIAGTSAFGWAEGIDRRRTGWVHRLPDDLMRDLKGGGEA